MAVCTTVKAACTTCYQQSTGTYVYQNTSKVFAQTFPGATMSICLYHTLRTFRREITTDKLRITWHTRIIKRNTTNYMDNCCQLSTSPRSVCTYFEQNWHSLRKQWTMVEKLKTQKFLQCISFLMGRRPKSNFNMLAQKPFEWGMIHVGLIRSFLEAGHGKCPAA